MNKQTFMLDKLYNEILAELQILYTDISMSHQTYNYDDYSKGIAKMIAVDKALGIDTQEVEELHGA